MTLTAVATQPLSRFNLDFAGETAERVTVNGRTAGLKRSAQELIVTPATSIAQGERFTVRVGRFTATPLEFDENGESSPFIATRDGTVLAGQPDGAHRLFPCNDHPRDKARFRFRLRVPTGWKAVASGARVGRPTTTARGGSRVWRYEERQPMATQVAQVAVGDFTVAARGTSAGVKVRDVVPRRLASQWLPKLDAELAQVEWMHSQVGGGKGVQRRGLGTRRG